MPYEILPHTADFRVRGWGRSLEELFSSIAMGMAEGSCGRREDPEEAKKGTPTKIAVEGTDNESLLVNFLNELIYLYNVEHKFYWAFEITVTSEAKQSRYRLSGHVWGLPVRQVSAELKAATYHGLKVEKKKNVWEATVVFDI